MTATIDRIWKYTVPVDDQVYAVSMPKDATIIHVGEDPDTVAKVNLWVAMPRKPGPFATIERDFLVVGTGHVLPISAGRVWAHRGTVVLASDRLVWHLMELVAPGKDNYGT